MSISTLYLAQASAPATGDPNWLVIGILVGLFVVLAIVLMLPSKRAITDDSGKALEDPTKQDNANKIENKTDKEKLSLAEIKEVRRESVSADKSKEELRELRKERRAATQTDKAVHERESEENAQSEKVKAAVDSEKVSEKEDATEEKKVETVQEKADEKPAESEPEKEEKPAEREPEKKEEKPADEAITAPIDDVVIKSDTDANDVFNSLFGGSDLSELNFDDLGSTSKPVDDTAFPTLGSALIPLSEITEANKEAKKEEINPLDELTKRLAEKAEKKTHH